MKLEDINKILKEKQKYFFDGKEKDFENYVKNNIREIFNYLKLPKIIEVHQQKSISTENMKIKPDLMILHDDNSISIAEIKCTNHKYSSTAPTEQCKAIGQILLYNNIIKEITCKKIRLFLIDTKIHFRTVCVFSYFKLPVILMEIQNDRIFIPYGLEYLK